MTTRYESFDDSFPDIASGEHYGWDPPLCGSLDTKSFALLLFDMRGNSSFAKQRATTPESELEFYFSTGSTPEGARSCSRRRRARATLLEYVHVALGKKPASREKLMPAKREGG
mgnify:CR=1 FL=1